MFRKKGEEEEDSGSERRGRRRRIRVEKKHLNDLIFPENFLKNERRE